MFIGWKSEHCYHFFERIQAVPSCLALWKPLKASVAAQISFLSPSRSNSNKLTFCEEKTAAARVLTCPRSAPSWSEPQMPRSTTRSVQSRANRVGVQTSQAESQVVAPDAAIRSECTCMWINRWDTKLNQVGICHHQSKAISNRINIRAICIRRN